MSGIKPKQLQLNFGALVPSIAEQIDMQGLVIARSVAQQFQNDADAIIRLVVRQLIPDSMARQIRQRLIKRIAAECKSKKEKQ